MELREPAIDTPRPSVPLRNGKTLADDPFSPYQSRGIRQGFLVASADNLIAWARTGSLMWMQFGLARCTIDKSFCGLVGRRRPKSTVLSQTNGQVSSLRTCRNAGRLPWTGSRALSARTPPQRGKFLQ